MTAENLAVKLNFHDAKRRFESILSRGEKTLNKFYDAYQETKKGTFKEIDFGNTKRRFHIDEALDEKNLEAFAELFHVLRKMRERVEIAQSSEDLAKIVLG